MTKLLIEEPALQVLPTLAVRLGLNEAIAVQQLHFALRTFESRVVETDGRRWLRADTAWWCRQFPWWSEATIKRVWANLRERGVVHTKRGRESSVYAIDYVVFDALSDQSDPSYGADCAHGTDQIDPSPSIGERTTERKEKTLASAGADTAVAPPLFETPSSNQPSAVPAADADTEIVREVWEHHRGLFGDRFRVKGLTPSRERTIRKALKAVAGDKELLKRASDGLKFWREHHQGGSQDVAISVIFETGPHSGKSLTDQIEWWASQADEASTQRPDVPSVLRDRIMRRRVWVVEMHSQPDNMGARERGMQALAWLREHANEEPVVQDDRVVEWRPVAS